VDDEDPHLAVTCGNADLSLNHRMGILARPGPGLPEAASDGGEEAERVRIPEISPPLPSGAQARSASALSV
jgi:hypothetical protein